MLDDKSVEIKKGHNRIDWIDCAKGIGIILVIIGHTMPKKGFGSEAEQAIRAIISSFHMPLFFILSCVTFHLSTTVSEFLKTTKRSFKHLIIPALYIFLLRSIIVLINNINIVSLWDYIKERTLILLFSSGVDANIAGTTIPALGMPWFLVVLFFGRTLFDYFHLKIKLSYFDKIIILITVVGIWLGSVLWLPLSFDVVLAAMGFFLLGSYIKRIGLGNGKLKYAFLWLILWGASFLTVYLVFDDFFSMAGRNYPMFPVSYFAAISGALFVSHLSMLMAKKIYAKPIIYIGKYSLFFYCAHTMDYLFDSIWNVTESVFINFLLRIFIVCIVSIVLIKVIALVKSKRNGIKE